ncbi:MAG: hypothetical protein AAGL69_10465 [Pseudomonadota bacterium]
MSGVFRAVCAELDDRLHRYQIIENGGCVSFGSAFQLLRDDPQFRSILIAALVESPFSAYRWETPSVTRETADRDFEFVLLGAPGLKRAPDPSVFAEHFKADVERSVVAFENLGGDAMMVVPCPVGDSSKYCHLADFVRTAPQAQAHALWQAVGEKASARLSHRPMWINTAGGGVAWLHVRMDSTPKYYHHAPYRL